MVQLDRAKSYVIYRSAAFSITLFTTP